MDCSEAVSMDIETAQGPMTRNPVPMHSTALLCLRLSSVCPKFALFFKSTTTRPFSPSINCAPTKSSKNFDTLVKLDTWMPPYFLFLLYPLANLKELKTYFLAHLSDYFQEIFQGVYR
jgi:hypothetical protein